MYSFIVPHSWKKNFSKKTLPVKFLFIHFVSKREKEALSSSKSTTLSASSSCCLIILSWEANVHESQSTTVKVWGVKSASSIWSVSLQLFVDFLLFIFSIRLLFLPIISICVIIYIYIYKTKAFEASTIFHVSIFFFYFLNLI